MKTFFAIINWALSLFFLLLAITFLLASSQMLIVYTMLLLACVFFPPLHALIVAVTGKRVSWLLRGLLVGLILFLILSTMSDSSSKRATSHQSQSATIVKSKPLSSPTPKQASEQQRKLIWKELTLAWKSDDPRQAKNALLKKYNLTQEELTAIQDEALSKNWPPARPTPTPHPPQDIITRIVRSVVRNPKDVLIELVMLSSTKSGVRINFLAEENRTPAWTRDGIMMTVCDIIKKLSLHPDLHMVRNYEIHAWLMLEDEFGYKVEQRVVSISLSQAAAKNINWDIVSYERFQQIVQREGGLWIHPMLLKK